MLSPTLAALQNCLSNALDDSAVGANLIAGVLGDAPSQYSKSPQLWNAAFRHLGIDGVYLPFDVDDARVGDFLRALRDCDRLLGVNVTVPHKLHVMEYLDELDSGAARIRAVNTIVRARDGRLIGYNTDGEGFIESIFMRQPDRPESFVRSLSGMTVVVLGAGGSARAVAFHAADHANGGRIIICNRTLEHAVSLAVEIKKAGCDALAIGEEELAACAPRAGLIVNCTTKGQGGLRKLPDGRVQWLEPYSSLAPAHPVSLPEPTAGTAAKASQDIDANNRASLSVARSVPPQTRFYDLIYHPEETVFLRHGRLTGHPTMNGKSLIINQAVIAFCDRICAAELQRRGLVGRELRRRILEIMYGAW
jgi:shikimate dehydrogenase